MSTPAPASALALAPAPAPASWSRRPIPEVSPSKRALFEAHSVTAATRLTDIVTPFYAWVDLQAEQLPESSKEAVIAAAHVRGTRSDDIDTIILAIPEVIPRLWGPEHRTGGALVVFGAGTIIQVSPEMLGPARPRFAGFVPPPGAQGIPYRIPAHRFPQGKAEARIVLQAAQRRYDDLIARQPSQKDVIEVALAVLAMTEYPRPGTPGSNANVTFLWSQPSRGEAPMCWWLALVRCGNTPAPTPIPAVFGSFVMVLGEGNPKSSHMKVLADRGREALRCDYLSPEIVAVIPV